MEQLGILPNGSSDICPQACSHHGHCTSKGCICEPYFSGDDCSQSFIEDVGGDVPFYVFMALVCVLHAVVLGLFTVDFYLRWAATRQCYPLNYRDMSSFCCMMACALRFAWLIDSDVTRASLSGDVVYGVLLRLPQALWVCSFLLVTMIWSAILAAAEQRAVGRRAQVFVVVAVVVLLLIVLPVSILDAIRVHSHTDRQGDIYANIADAVLAFYVLCLNVGGVYFSCQLSSLYMLLGHHSTSQLSARQQRARRLLLTALVVVVISTVLGFTLASWVVAVAAADVSMQGTPKSWFTYMWFMHFVCEGGCALALYFATRQERRTAAQQGTGRGRYGRRSRSPGKRKGSRRGGGSGNEIRGAGITPGNNGSDTPLLGAPDGPDAMEHGGGERGGGGVGPPIFQNGGGPRGDRWAYDGVRVGPGDDSRGERKDDMGGGGGGGPSSQGNDPFERPRHGHGSPPRVPAPSSSQGDEPWRVPLPGNRRGEHEAGGGKYHPQNDAEMGMGSYVGTGGQQVQGLSLPQTTSPMSTSRGSAGQSLPRRAGTDTGAVRGEVAGSAGGPRPGGHARRSGGGGRGRGGGGGGSGRGRGGEHMQVLGAGHVPGVTSDMAGGSSGLDIAMGAQSTGGSGGQQGRESGSSLVQQSWTHGGGGQVGSLDSMGGGLRGARGSDVGMVGTLGSRAGVLLPEDSASTGPDSDGTPLGGGGGRGQGGFRYA